ncbi:MAG: BrnT family toxin [Schwartzia sp.]|nr:BrnT family toxin [Schwartzia sp. (in: firmicutes)]
MRKIIFDRVFEWDDEKNKANLKKHGISFESAVYVFEDQNYVEFPDEFHSDKELRYKVIGMVDKLLLVICTDREDVTRIISARKANAQERRLYNDYRA